MTSHDWQSIVLGRICRECKVVQAKDEFDDTLECPGDKARGEKPDKPGERRRTDASDGGGGARKHQ